MKFIIAVLTFAGAMGFAKASPVKARCTGTLSVVEGTIGHTEYSLPGAELTIIQDGSQYRATITTPAPYTAGGPSTILQRNFFSIVRDESTDAWDRSNGTVKHVFYYNVGGGDENYFSGSGPKYSGEFTLWVTAVLPRMGAGNFKSECQGQM